MTLKRATDPVGLVDQLVRLLTVEQEGPDLYTGQRLPEGSGRVFGGEIIAQALMAATHTVDPDKIAHSLHAYFVRGGSEDHPTQYQVSRDFDGRSFSTRRVTATQQGEVILNFASSFQRFEEGLEHQDAMPDAPPPESLKTEHELTMEAIDRIPEALRERFTRASAIEFRPISPKSWMMEGPSPAYQQAWFKLVRPCRDDPLIHRAILTYVSDMMLLGTCVMPHGLSWMRGELSSASLDHAVWLHDDFRVDDWLLFTSTSPISRRGRGLNHAQIFARDGRLVASVAQEGLIRRRRV